MKKKFIITLLCIFILIPILNIKGDWESYEYSSAYYSEKTYLEGGTGVLELNKNIQYRIRYKVELKEGAVIGQLYDSTYDIEEYEKPKENEILASIEMNQSGTYYMDLPVKESGEYYLTEFAQGGSKASVSTYVETKRSLLRMLYKKYFTDNVGFD